MVDELGRVAAVGLAARARVGAPPPLPSASPPTAFLQPRQQRLRALMLRAAGRVQRQWRAHQGAEEAGSSAGDEAADYGRVLAGRARRRSSAAAVAARVGTLADAMLHASGSTAG